MPVWWWVQCVIKLYHYPCSQSWISKSKTLYSVHRKYCAFTYDIKRTSLQSCWLLVRDWTTFNFKKQPEIWRKCSHSIAVLIANFCIFFQYLEYKTTRTDITLSHILDCVQTRGAKILHTNSPWRINVVRGAKYLWHLKRTCAVSFFWNLGCWGGS